MVALKRPTFSQMNWLSGCSVHDTPAKGPSMTNCLGTRRYLWTDAFGVCAYLSLYHATKEDRYVLPSEKV